MGIKPVLIISLWFYSKCCLLAQTRMSSPSISADHYITHLSEAKLQSRPVLYCCMVNQGKPRLFYWCHELILLFIFYFI